MAKINIVFENDFEDADIISIPDYLLPTIVEIGQKFLNWIPSADDNDYFTIIAGRQYFVAETDGFVKWLNTYDCRDTEKAFVVSSHTNIGSEYKTLEF